MPGLIITIFYDYMFDGEIMRPECTITMKEKSVVCQLGNTVTKIIARMYKSEDTISYAPEIEFLNWFTHTETRSVLSVFINTIEWTRSISKLVNTTFINEVRYVSLARQIIALTKKAGTVP